MYIEKIKQQLKDECIKFQEEARKEKQAHKIIKNNLFEEKFFTLIGFSTLTFVPCLLLISIFGLPAVAIPQLIPVALLGGSIGIGTIINIILEKTTFKTKDKLKEITSLKKQADLLKEEIDHEIKYEIANNKNKAIQQVLDNIDFKNKILSSVSSNYTIKHNNKLSIEQITKNINELKIKLSKAFNELSNSTKRNFLSNKFWRSRDTFQTIIDAIVIPMMVGLFFMITWNFPIFLSVGSVGALNLLLPFPISQIIGVGYIIKRTKTNNKVFNKLNSELKEDSLSKKTNYDEEKKLPSEVEDKIKNICAIYSELIEQQELLEVKKAEEKEDSKQNKKQKNKGFSALKIFIDGEPVNKNPLTDLPEPIMSLYGIHGYCFDTKDQLEDFCKQKNYLLEDAYKLDYLGSVANRNDVITKTKKDGRTMLYTAVDEDGYGMYNYERSVYRGEFVWEYNYGQIREFYKPFRDRGIVFNNDVYAKVDEYYKKIMDMIDENGLFGHSNNEEKGPQLTKKKK